MESANAISLAHNIWQDWLRICCNRFRHHSTLNDPHNPAAVEVCEICRKHVWNREE